jgi:hypothetical protein
VARAEGAEKISTLCFGAGSFPDASRGVTRERAFGFGLLRTDDY